MNRIKNLLLICVSSLLPLMVFLLVDLSVGLWRLDANPVVNEFYEKNERFSDGWYELKPSFDENIFFYSGKRSHRVITNKQRYRVGSEEYICPDLCTDLLFLGDSYTFGVNGDWEDTFPGIVQLNSTGFNVLNAGNDSYSVTPYNYIYQRYLRTRDDERPHVVVIAVDLSDVQDEAAFWKAGAEHPVKTQWGLERLRQAQLEKRRKDAESNSGGEVEYPFRAYLPYSHSIWGYFKYGLLGSDAYLINRAAFTYTDWQLLDKDYPPDGFLPLGVSAGIANVKSGLKRLLREVDKNNGESVFLVYPWPNQLVFKDTHFDWPEFIRSICEEESCVGVVDLFPVMRKYKQSHPVDWYNQLYVSGDTHFNTKGNRMIADHLLEFLRTKTSNPTDQRE